MQKYIVTLVAEDSGAWQLVTENSKGAWDLYVGLSQDGSGVEPPGYRLDDFLDMKPTDELHERAQRALLQLIAQVILSKA